MVSSTKNKAAAKNIATALRRVAVHEAGHAVVAYALGMPVGDISIEPGVTSDGEKYAGQTMITLDPRILLRSLDEYVEPADDSPSREEETFQFRIKNMQVSFGGKVAEELFFGGADDGGLGPDYDAINRLAELICPPDAQEGDEKKIDAPPGATYERCLELVEKKATVSRWEEDYFKDWVEHRTRKLLRNRRDLIEAVARELLSKKKLSERDVARTIVLASRRGAASTTKRCTRSGEPRS